MSGLDLPQLITSLVRITGLDSTELDDTDATLFLNRSFWEILDKFPFREKEVIRPFEIVADVSRYQIPSDTEAFRKLVLIDPETQEHIPLTQETLDTYEENTTDELDSGFQGEPKFYHRHDDAFVLRPTPDRTYNMIVYHWLTLADLESPDNETVVIPRVWHEIVLYGGAWRVFSDIIGDTNQMQTYRGVQTNLISTTTPVEAKEKEDMRMAGIDIPDGVNGVDTYFQDNNGLPFPTDQESFPLRQRF